MSHCPIQNLCDQVTARVDALALGFRVEYGASALFHIDSPNSAVFIPVSGARGANITAGAEDDLKIAGCDHLFHVHCWGGDDSTTHLVANNVMTAIFECLGGNARYAGHTWLRSDQDTPQDIAGVLVLEVSISAPWISRYVAIPPFTDGIQDAASPPTVPVVTPVDFEFTLESTPNTESDGEVAGTIEAP